jgi:hypothetical protein
MRGASRLLAFSAGVGKAVAELVINQADATIGWSIDDTSTNDLYEITLSGTGPSTFANWTHVAFTYSSLTGQGTLYVQGK